MPAVVVAVAAAAAPAEEAIRVGESESVDRWKSWEDDDADGDEAGLRSCVICRWRNAGGSGDVCSLVIVFVFDLVLVTDPSDGGANGSRGGTSDCGPPTMAMPAPEGMAPRTSSRDGRLPNRCESARCGLPWIPGERAMGDSYEVDRKVLLEPRLETRGGVGIVPSFPMGVRPLDGVVTLLLRTGFAKAP